MSKSIFVIATLIALLVGYNESLVIGTVNQNNLLNYPIEVDGTILGTKLVLDGNWHWLHTIPDPNRNCNPNGWDKQICPDPKTCWNACAIEGVPTNQWSDTYGIRVQGDAMTLGYVTKSNVGSRVYIVDSTSQKYYGFNMLGKELSFDADMSQAGCGLNGAMYFVEMPLDGGPNLSQGFPAQVGLGYCDAQCTSVKYINGEAVGIPGFYEVGACCAEFDIW
jgi:cellulose 1,4-beta-cellobiosidase